MLSTLLEAITGALLKHVDAIVGALVVAVIAWIKLLGERAHARREVAESAVRQALDLHGDSPEADQAAADELHRVSARVRPKDVPTAVARARERVVSASVPPASGVVRPIDMADEDRPTIPDQEPPA